MSLWFDLKYAWRLLTKSWGYALMCASVVALSVGLAVWTYAVVYSQTKPLPFEGSDRWYSIQLAVDKAPRFRPSVDLYTYQRLLARPSLQHLGAWANQSAVLSEGQATTSLRGALITPRLLSETGVAPLLGRLFIDTDGQRDAAPVAVLSHDTWQNYFAGDPSIVGKTARIDARPVQIVGVLPREFLAFDDYELWMPLPVPSLTRPEDSTLTVFPLIVAEDAAAKASAEREVNATITAVNGDYPRLFNAARRAAVYPAARMFTHSITPVLVMMSFMAGAVLLLGCVNISMVFFARLLERSRELALRNALGASRGRLLRQCLLETAVVIAAGLAAGYALAAAGIYWTHGISDFGAKILASGRSPNLPQLRPFDFAVAVAAAIAVWLLSTLIPAFRVSRQDAAEVLAGSGKGATIRGSNRSVAFLVGVQVVISCLVLVSCGSVVAAMHLETTKPLGLVTEGVIVSTYPTSFDTRHEGPSQRLRYWESVRAAVSAKLPGAQTAFTSTPPSRPARVAASIETREGGDKGGALTIPVTTVSENYFGVMGLRLRSGRFFDSSDNASSLRVAVIDEKMAARYWPDQNVLGKRVRINAAKDGWLTIVGVVSGVRGAPYRPDSDIGTLYLPLRQALPAAFHAVIRTPNPAADSRAAIRAAAFAVDRDLPLHNLQRLDDYVKATTQEYPAMTRVFIVIGLITALLAASGLFGLISRSVAQRTQEVGIRRALGATPLRATSMFMRQGGLYLSVAVVGLVLGVLLMPSMSRAFPNILERAFPVTFGVALLMAGVISIASYLPTRRAVALEPGDALRYE
jgi:putative ABC transport system permease protein